MKRSNIFKNFEVELLGYRSIRSIGSPKYDTMLTWERKHGKLNKVEREFE